MSNLVDYAKRELDILYQKALEDGEDSAEYQKNGKRFYFRNC